VRLCKTVAFAAVATTVILQFTHIKTQIRIAVIMSSNSQTAPPSVTAKSNSTSERSPHNQTTKLDNESTTKNRVFSSSSSPSQHLSIISLSKLKDYMPQSRVATKLLSCTNAIKSNQIARTPVACYRGSLDLSSSSSNPSQCKPPSTSANKAG